MPGAQAPTSNVFSLWNSMVRWILKSSSASFAKFLRSLRSIKPSVHDGTADHLWPMPPPYPKWLEEGAKEKKNYKRMCIEKFVNLLVLCLSWMSLGKPATASPGMALHSPLTKRQKQVVQRMERLSAEFFESKDIKAADMGRSAAKVESLSALLTELQEVALTAASPYEHRFPAQGPSDEACKAGHDYSHPGRVVGSLKNGELHLAKCVEPSRLSFPNAAPQFDPMPLLEEPHKSMYMDPISQAVAPEELTVEPPRVRIHASKEQALGLFQLLDANHRLRLVPEEKIRKGFWCGAFSLCKDAKKDRLILDARPPNMLEETLKSWCKTLGAISTVLQLELEPSHNLAISSSDLRDFYYCFRVSRARAARNIFNFGITPEQAQHFNCFHDHMKQHKLLYPCLSTMAMGDTQAVEMGQLVHVKLGLRCEAVRPSELLTVHGRAVRGNLSCGIVIDDVVFLEQVPRMLKEEDLKSSEGARRLRLMTEEYLAQELMPHPDKMQEAKLSGEFWGASVDGEAGHVRAALRRLIPLMDATCRTARLGLATVSLLQTLAGSWCSIFQMRRRMLCLLDEVYHAQQGRRANDVVELSGALVDELWSCVVLAPMAVTDLRAQSEGKLYLTDASEDAKASVVADLPKVFAKELNRHSLAKGCWSRLLSPWKVWLRQHFQLDDEGELPGGVPLVSHPLWLQLAQVLRFRLRHRKWVRTKKHINILELEAVLELEERLGKHGTSLRYLCGSDSQVVLAALLKGRSSSYHLNRRLQESLPNLLGCGIYGNYGYIPSNANAGDDPTRMTELRTPCKEMPEWMSEAFAGRFQLMDAWLAERGYDPMSLAELPFTPEVAEKQDVLKNDLLPELRAVQKADRLAAFDQKVYSGVARADFPVANLSSVDSLANVGSEPLGHQETKQESSGKMNRAPHGCCCFEIKVGLESWNSNFFTQFLAESFSLAAPKVCSLEEQFFAQVPLVQEVWDGSLTENTKDTRTEEEPDGLTKNEQEDPPGKMNRGLQSKAVVSKRSSKTKSSESTATGSSEPPRDQLGTREVKPWSGVCLENGRSPVLSHEAKELLSQLPRECFIGPGGKRLAANEPLDFRRRGFLDLYSGRCAVAKALARRFNVWVLTFDIEHGDGQDLLRESLQQKLISAVRALCFLGVGAAPECCSFSRAVTPAVRSASLPYGLPNLTENMQVKVARGNAHAAFLLALLEAVTANGLPYWVENPDGSFLWLLPEWIARGYGAPEQSYRFDMCRYHTPWRKRTRIATNTCLAGERHLCLRDHRRVILRGRNRDRRMSWTRLAQEYPKKMAEDLAVAMGIAAELTPYCRSFNVGECAKCGSGRIGEADNPGPARVRRVQRDPSELAGVALVEPVTLAIQQRVWAGFEKWLHDVLSDDSIAQLTLCPTLYVEVLRSYGFHLYGHGHRLYEFRHFLVIVQQRYPWMKPHMQPAWNLVTKWQSLRGLRNNWGPSRDPGFLLDIL
eukprot:Skav232464  [mRNA]  locus=scaffold2877:29131:33540:+ [translate_table: standard]